MPPDQLSTQQLVDYLVQHLDEGDVVFSVFRLQQMKAEGLLDPWTGMEGLFTNHSWKGRPPLVEAVIHPDSLLRRTLFDIVFSFVPDPKTTAAYEVAKERGIKWAVERMDSWAQKGQRRAHTAKKLFSLPMDKVVDWVKQQKNVPPAHELTQNGPLPPRPTNPTTANIVQSVPRPNAGRPAPPPPVPPPPPQAPVISLLSPSPEPTISPPDCPVHPALNPPAGGPSNLAHNGSSGDHPTSQDKSARQVRLSIRASKVDRYNLWDHLPAMMGLERADWEGPRSVILTCSTRQQAIGAISRLKGRITLYFAALVVPNPPGANGSPRAVPPPQAPRTGDARNTHAPLASPPPQPSASHPVHHVPASTAPPVIPPASLPPWRQPGIFDPPPAAPRAMTSFGMRQLASSATMSRPPPNGPSSQRSIPPPPLTPQTTLAAPRAPASRLTVGPPALGQTGSRSTNLGNLAAPVPRTEGSVRDDAVPYNSLVIPTKSLVNPPIPLVGKSQTEVPRKSAASHNSSRDGQGSPKRQRLDHAASDHPRVVVQGLPPTDPGGLLDRLARETRCGAVVEDELKFSRASGDFSGSFRVASAALAQKAVDELDGKVVEGKKLVVWWEAVGESESASRGTRLSPTAPASSSVPTLAFAPAPTASTAPTAPTGSTTSTTLTAPTSRPLPPATARMLARALQAPRSHVSDPPPTAQPSPRAPSPGYAPPPPPAPFPTATLFLPRSVVVRTSTAPNRAGDDAGSGAAGEMDGGLDELEEGELVEVMAPGASGVDGGWEGGEERQAKRAKRS